ncbi:hypothetical protein [Corynebacterium sp.]|uniref:hypothetical protein n=1 Tax=Corynebacterium sp. TaxID=1720 RepID=UPI003735D573
MRRIALSAIALSAGLGLAACGGATVDSEDVTESSSPAPVATSPSQTSTKDTTTEETTPVAPPADDQPEDLGAREIEEIPTTEAPYIAEEQDFLDEIAGSDINVENVESQLIGTAHTICGGESITRDAVAGQLIEQGRTDLDHQEVTKLLDDAAHANLC